MIRRTTRHRSVKVPRIRPIVLALKPRSWPSTGTAKVCTSQQADSSQLTSSSRFKPGARSRSQARLPAAARRAVRGCLQRGTRRAEHQRQQRQQQHQQRRPRGSPAASIMKPAAPAR